MKVLTEKQLSQTLGISYWTIRKLRLTNELPHLKLGSRIFYQHETIAKWLKQQESFSLKQEKEKGNEHYEETK